VDAASPEMFKGRMVCDVESARVNLRSVRNPDGSEDQYADQRTHNAEEEQSYVVRSHKTGVRRKPHCWRCGDGFTAVNVRLRFVKPVTGGCHSDKSNLRRIGEFDCIYPSLSHILFDAYIRHNLSVDLRVASYVTWFGIRAISGLLSFSVPM